MAGKKPAKPIAGQSRQQAEDPNIYGTKTLFVGSKTAKSECAQCGKSVIRGMIRVLKDSHFCSKGCVTSFTQAKSSSQEIIN